MEKKKYSDMLCRQAFINEQKGGNHEKAKTGKNDNSEL